MSPPKDDDPGAPQEPDHAAGHETSAEPSQPPVADEQPAPGAQPEGGGDSAAEGAPPPDGGQRATPSPPGGRFLSPGFGTAWREEAYARALEIRTLSNWIDDLLPQERGEKNPKADAHLAEAIRGHVEVVKSAAERARGHPMWTGARLGRVASHLHAAEADLLRRAPLSYLCGELPNLDAHVRRHLPVDDPRRMRVEDLARKARDDLVRAAPQNGSVVLHPLDRESLIAAFRAASSAAEREQQRVRRFRNVVLAATVLLFVIAVLVGWLGAAKPTFLALCFTPQPGPREPAVLVCPTGQNPLPATEDSAAVEGTAPAGTTAAGTATQSAATQAPATQAPATQAIPAEGTATGAAPTQATVPAKDVDDAVIQTVSSWDVPLIEITGMVAAGVTGAVALRRLRGSSTPFDVPVALNLLKLPTGALTAFLGLLLMRGGFVPGLTALDTTPQIIAWAVIFGASQQLVTGLVDRQAQTVLESVGGKTYTATGGG